MEQQTAVTLEKMAEQHLLNVQRQIQSLNEQKSQIDVEIQRLTDYFNSGVDALRQTRAVPSQAIESVVG
jgi:hypothetical protein